MDWVKDLKPGDIVLAFGQRCPVVRLTATQVVFRRNGREFRARFSDQCVIGHTTGYRTSRIRQATPEALAELAESENLQWARNQLPYEVAKLPADKIAKLRGFFHALRAE